MRPMFPSRSFKIPPYRGFAESSMDDQALASMLKGFREMAGSPSAETLHEGRNKITAVALSSQAADAVVKVFGARGFHKWKTLALPSKGFRAWAGATGLVENGFETARPIAAFERRKGGVAVESVFIAERIRGGREIRELFRGPESALTPLIDALAPLLSRLHDAGLVHRDLSDGNILVLALNRHLYPSPARLALNMNGSLKP